MQIPQCIFSPVSSQGPVSSLDNTQKRLNTNFTIALTVIRFRGVPQANKL